MLNSAENPETSNLLLVLQTIIFVKWESIQVYLNIVPLTCSLTGSVSGKNTATSFRECFSRGLTSPARTHLVPQEAQEEDAVITSHTSLMKAQSHPSPQKRVRVASAPLTPFRHWALCQVLRIKRWARSSLSSRSFKSSGERRALHDEQQPRLISRRRRC